MSFNGNAAAFSLSALKRLDFRFPMASRYPGARFFLKAEPERAFDCRLSESNNTTRKARARPPFSIAEASVATSKLNLAARALVGA